jgi:hypothetical protein
MSSIHRRARRQQKPHCLAVITECSTQDVVRAWPDTRVQQQLHDRRIAAHCCNGQKRTRTAPRFMRIATLREQLSDLDRIPAFHGFVKCVVLHALDREAMLLSLGLCRRRSSGAHLPTPDPRKFFP